MVEDLVSGNPIQPVNEHLLPERVVFKDKIDDLRAAKTREKLKKLAWIKSHEQQVLWQAEELDRPTRN